MHLRACLAAVAVVGLSVTGCSSDSSEPGTASPEPSSSADAPAAAYVALGDSYTSAVGVPEVVDAGCGRSSVNYPALVAEQLGLTLADVSCSGASTLSLTEAQETSAGPVPPQLSALAPGTELVTVGLGGNDEALFTDLLINCLGLAASDPAGSPCRDALVIDGVDRPLETIALIQDRLTSALAEIRDRAPDAQVVLVGYPQLVPAEGRCESLPLTPEDYLYFRGVVAALGDATKAAAAEAEVEYVDVLAASEGHDVCAGEDAWVNGIANDLGRSAAPMHPFGEEQSAIADLVVGALGEDTAAD